MSTTPTSDIGFNQPRVTLAKHEDGETAIEVTTTRDYLLRLFPTCGCTVVEPTVSVSAGTTKIPVQIKGRVVSDTKKIVIQAFKPEALHLFPQSFTIYVAIEIT